MSEIRTFADRVVAEWQPEKIVLFGSHAYGRPGPDSDVDLLLILRFRGNPLRKSGEILSKLNPRIPVDLLVRTPGDVRKRLRWNDFFIREIMERGVVLYDAANA